MLQIQLWPLGLITLLSAIALDASQSPQIGDRSLKFATFLSPPFFLQPGAVANKYYFNIPFPKGHIALKSFDAEVVDEMGIPVPLHETYLHHWVVERYHGEKKTIIPDGSSTGLNHSKLILVRNDGICNHTLGQYFGLGSETRRTATFLPKPYGIEVGNPEKIPDGYEERWLLNVHAIDTRGVEDRVGCIECKCSLYNVTKDEFGQPLQKEYVGGLNCCYDQTQCQVRDGFKSIVRKLYLRYTVKWFDWDDSIVPVKIYIFDVTDTQKAPSGHSQSSCKVEYQVKACGPEGKANGECVDTKQARLVIPHGGDIVYGVAHQHAGGISSALHGQDGRVLCTSIPIYGEGKEAGNEADYIVGMSTCYPKPGSVKVADGEVLTLVSNYSSTQMHTGVMGLFYVLVANPRPRSTIILSHSLPSSWGLQLSKHTWAFVVAAGILAAVIGISYRPRHNREGYESIATM